MGRKGGWCGGKRRDWKRKWQEERNVVFLPNAGDGGSEEREEFHAVDWQVSAELIN